jgi:predicted benzoate:H+ symporter BenE
VYGVVIVLGAVLAGPSARATAARRWMAPVLDDRAGIAWGVVAGAFLLLVLWGPTHALRTAWGIALLAALLAGGIIALRRQIQREFPSAGQE